MQYNLTYFRLVQQQQSEKIFAMMGCVSVRLQPFIYSPLFVTPSPATWEQKLLAVTFTVY